MMDQPLLQIDRLVKRYGGLLATDHANLTVRRGEVHALIGPNGAGKTTLIHQISGAIESDGGRILLDGHDIRNLPMHERVHRGLARSYQIVSLFGRLSVLDNIALAVQGRKGSGARPWHLARPNRERYDEAAELAGRCGLDSDLAKVAGSLSHGRQRRLDVALALAARPKLLLLDEPMAGMGPEESAQMVSLLEQVGLETTLLLVEHDMDAVFRLATCISVLVHGRVIATGAPEYIRSHDEVRRAYLGDDAEPNDIAAQDATACEEVTQ